jgi:hypothetical protein
MANKDQGQSGHQHDDQHKKGQQGQGGQKEDQDKQANRQKGAGQQGGHADQNRQREAEHKQVAVSRAATRTATSSADFIQEQRRLAALSLYAAGRLQQQESRTTAGLSPPRSSESKSDDPKN